MKLRKMLKQEINANSTWPRPVHELTPLIEMMDSCCQLL